MYNIDFVGTLTPLPSSLVDGEVLLGAIVFAGQLGSWMSISGDP